MVGRPFRKGQSGNPAGRPKTAPEIKAMFEAKGPEAFEVLVEQLSNKDQRIRQAAAIAILDRAYGKPTQQIGADIHMSPRAWIGPLPTSNDRPLTNEEWEAKFRQRDTGTASDPTPG